MLNDSTAARRKQVEERLSHFGLSLRSWATANGFSPSMVHAVIAGRVSCRFGKSHQIAVLLGLKDGEVLGRAHAASSNERTSFAAEGCASRDTSEEGCTSSLQPCRTGE